MIINIILLLIIIPLVSAALCIFIPNKYSRVTEMLALLATFVNLLLAVYLFNSEITFTVPWLGSVMFSLRLYHFSAFIVAATAGFGFLVTLYSVVSMRGKQHLNQFYAYALLSVALTNGAVLAENLLVMLFFWEGLLLTLFGMIAIGGKDAFKTAIKAFIIVGICDLCMMVGIAITGLVAGTLEISQIHLDGSSLAGVAFVLLMIGAISKAGSMPFHSWIPDASQDAPLPFMSLVPAALEKLLGIYFLARISLDMFAIDPHGWGSTLLMIIGAVTILLAVMMALIQSNYKKLLSFHAISQVGYMILGIGTAVPAGIVGGLFHMINHALYKSCLFLTGGSVEKQTGTTNLKELGGIGKKMPITFICFIITAAAISGMPPLNGFFSKELVYDGALERGWIFYVAAVLGTFLTAASFLKLGHSVFMGKISDKNKDVKEASWVMLVPMIVIASICVLFGLYSYLPLKMLIQPILGEGRLEGLDFATAHINWTLTGITILVLVGALLNHLWGVKSKGSALKAVDHIHYCPGLATVYDKAERRVFDPYEIGLKITAFLSMLGYWCDRAVDWVYDVFIVKIVDFCGAQVRRAHTGNYSLYLSWSLVGMAMVIIFLVYSK